MILLDDIHHEEDAPLVATHIINGLNLPFQLLKNKEIDIGASIGSASVRSKVTPAHY